jgi:hypothetical protein
VRKSLDIQDLRRVRLAPGDTLLVRSKERLTQHQLKQFREAVTPMMAQLFPNNKVLVVDSNVELAILSQNE